MSAGVGVQGSHKDVLTAFPKRVFFTGTGALVKGQGLCYDADRGTAADAEAERDKYVELPTTSNNLHFAGVSVEGYSARSSGQWITIFEPGSVCQVAIGVDSVVDSTLMTCSVNTVDAGRFTKQGFPGRGTAMALQTNASGVLASGEGGDAALDSTGLIITDSSAFSGLTAGKSYDVYVLAGEDDGTDLVTGLKTTGIYLTDNTLTLAAVASTTGGTMECTYYLQDGNQTCLAYLFDGNESGLQQVYQLTNGANTSLLASGMNYLHGGVDLSADADETLGDGSRSGQKCGIVLMGAMTTNNYVLTVTNGVIPGVAGTSSVVPIFVAIATATMDGDLDMVVFEWQFGEWVLKIASAAVVLAS